MSEVIIYKVQNRIMSQEMCKPPVWWPELPVTSEGDCGYGIIEYQPGKFRVESRQGMLK